MEGERSHAGVPRSRRIRCRGAGRRAGDMAPHRGARPRARGRRRMALRHRQPAPPHARQHRAGGRPRYRHHGAAHAHFDSWRPSQGMGDHAAPRRAESFHRQHTA